MCITPQQCPNGETNTWTRSDSPVYPAVFARTQVAFVGLQLDAVGDLDSDAAADATGTYSPVAVDMLPAVRSMGRGA